MAVDTTTHPGAAASSFPWDGGRDPAVDLVRGVAVLCMIVAHVKVWAQVSSEVATFALVLVNNVASPLFALVMGVSSGIVLTRADRRPSRAAFVVRNVVRGLILIGIGVALEQLGTFVAIVLQSLGATLVVASPLALLPVLPLAATAVTTFVAGPFVNAAVREAVGPAHVYSSEWVRQLLEWVVLSTHYRVVSLLPFVLAGVLLARHRLTVRAALVALAVGVCAGIGVVALRLSGRGFGVSEVVSGDVPDSLLDVALAGTALGVIVLLARWVPPGVLAATAPVRATGALALTAYVLHVCLIALTMRTTTALAAYDSWMLYSTGVLGITVLACWAWWSLLGTGPVERAMGLVTDRIR